MGEPPAGPVTMLFSDIEGSTALLGRLGDRYGEALSDHRSLLRAAFAAWRGREISTEGDSFFVVFESASDAVACGLAAQRALARHDCPDGDAVRVRMGLHTGEPIWYKHGHATEGRRWLQRAMDLASTDGGATLAQVAHGLGVLLDQVAIRTRPASFSSAAWPSVVSSATAKSRRAT